MKVFTVFWKLHRALYRLEYFITYGRAKRSAKIYQDCITAIYHYKPDIKISELFNDGTAIATIYIKKLTLLEEQKLHDEVQKLYPKFVGGVVLEQFNHVKVKKSR